MHRPSYGSHFRLSLIAALGLLSVLPSWPSPSEQAQATIRIRNHVLHRLSPNLIGFNFEDINYQTYGGVYSQLLYGQDFEEQVDIDDMGLVPPWASKYLFLRRRPDGTVKIASYGIERGDPRGTVEGSKDGPRQDVASQCVPLEQFSPSVQAELRKRISGDRQVSYFWRPIIAGSARARFELFTDRLFNGLQDQRIEFLEGTGEAGGGNVGLFRRGIKLEAGTLLPCMFDALPSAIRNVGTIADYSCPPMTENNKQGSHT